MFKDMIQTVSAAAKEARDRSARIEVRKHKTPNILPRYVYKGISSKEKTSSRANPKRAYRTANNIAPVSHKTSSGKKVPKSGMPQYNPLNISGIMGQTLQNQKDLYTFFNETAKMGIEGDTAPSRVKNYQEWLQKSFAPPISTPQAPVGSKDPEFKAFYEAIKQQESNGRYGAVGIPTKGGRALGAYQIMSGNIEGEGRGWDQEALGRDVTPSEFLDSPKLQDKIAQYKLRNYYRKYGAEGAAKAWYGGESQAQNFSESPEYGGPSLNDYANSVLGHMRSYQ